MPIEKKSGEENIPIHLDLLSQKSIDNEEIRKRDNILARVPTLVSY